jgi:uncharacterized protein (TIGR03503 family)
MAQLSNADTHSTSTSNTKISFFNRTSLLKNSLTGAVLALMFNLSTHAQQAPAEIEYYTDDNITNQIPYFDNRFRIDAQLEEVTLLFYRRSGTQPVILVQPNGAKLKINDLEKDKVQWFDDRTFDMIKIKSPMIGPWQVIGEVLPESKIMVISEINLAVEPLPEIILQGETLKMEGRIFNGEMAINDPSFNQVLTLDVDFFSTNNADFYNFGAEPVKLTSFRDDGRDLDEHANDSLFTGEFELNFAPGEWEPVYIVKMPMATRELRQSPVVVHKNPITISVATSQDGSTPHVATFAIDDSFVNPDSILIQGKVTFPDKQVTPFAVMKGKGKSRLHDIAYTEPGVHRIKIDIFGETTKGREFRATVPEFSFNVDRVGGPLIPNINGQSDNFDPDQKNTQVIVNAEMEAKKIAEALAQAKEVQKAEIADKSQTTLIYIIGGNTVVIIIAVLMFILMRRKKGK